MRMYERAKAALEKAQSGGTATAFAPRTWSDWSIVLGMESRRKTASISLIFSLVQPARRSRRTFPFILYPTSAKHRKFVTQTPCPYSLRRQPTTRCPSQHPQTGHKPGNGRFNVLWRSQRYQCPVCDDGHHWCHAGKLCTAAHDFGYQQLVGLW